MKPPFWQGAIGLGRVASRERQPGVGVPGAFRFIVQFTPEPTAADGPRAPLQAFNGPYLPRVNHGALFGLGQDFQVHANGFFAVVSVAAAVAIIGWSLRRTTTCDRWLC